MKSHAEMYGGNADNIECLKEHLCKQRGIIRLVIPYGKKDTEIGYAINIKTAFQSRHIFIKSDAAQDVIAVRRAFFEWRTHQNENR